MVDATLWPPVISATAALAGALIGATASAGGQIYLKSKETTERRKSLGYSLAAEIESYLNIIDRRDRVHQTENLVKLARSGVLVPLGGWFTKDERRKDFFPIFKANLSSIGILGCELSRVLGRFHREIEAVFATMSDAEDGVYDSYTAPQRADLIEGELEVWRGAVNTGKKLVQDLYLL